MEDTRHRRLYASTEPNFCENLVHDMEALREALGIGRWLLFGGSWGATLALAYTRQHRACVRGLVLRGVFGAQPDELDWLYKPGGPAKYFRKPCTHLPRQRRKALDPHHSLAMARISTRLFLRDPWLGASGQVWPAQNLQGIPGTIVEGQWDVVTPVVTAWQLHQSWPGSTLRIAPEGGHASSDPACGRR